MCGVSDHDNQKGLSERRKTLYEYRFVRANIGGSGDGGDYRKIVQEHATRGWRLVQVFALPLFDGYSMAQQVELIFERKTEPRGGSSPAG